MKDPNVGTNGSGQPANPNQLTTISERRLKANRENAKKSTGPKTARGKEYSAKNAAKHGLSTMDFSAGSMLRGEDPDEYQKLIDDLYQVFQPVGVAEELEVRLYAQLSWRRHRAGRYENAQLVRDQMPLVVDESQTKSDKEMIPEFETLIRLLQTVEKEICSTGAISLELQDKVFAMAPRLHGLWWYLEDRVKEGVTQKQQIEVEIIYGKRPRLLSVSLPEVRKQLCASLGSQPKISSVVHLATTKLVTRFVKRENAWTFELASDNEYDRHAIPNAEVMDKILRYEAAIERSLDRAIARLERLQRRRKGESVLPPVSVRLTQ